MNQLSEKEIVHGSVIIAEYMGAKVKQLYDDIVKPNIGTISGLMFYWSKDKADSSPDDMRLHLPMSALNYHKSWSALMPVYIKINKQISDRAHFDSTFAITTEDFQLSMWNNFEDEDCNIEKLFTEIVKFINYLNE